MNRKHKPKMRQQRGMWYCTVDAMNMTPVGTGKTQMGAYLDWASKTNTRLLDGSWEGEVLRSANSFVIRWYPTRG